MGDEISTALSCWCQYTGPWLAHFSPRKSRQVWERIIPQSISEYDATRHMLMAVVGTDKPMFDPDSQRLVRRSGQVAYHYSRALSALRATTSPTVDAILAMVLAWAFEVMMGNWSNAILHLEGSMALYRAFESQKLPHQRQESYEIATAHIPGIHKACYGYSSSRKNMSDISSMDFKTIPDALVAVAKPTGKTTAMEVCNLFNNILLTLPHHTHGVRGRPKQIQLDLLSCRYELLRFRHGSPIHSATIAAIHLLFDLGAAVSAKAVADPGSSGQCYDRLTFDWILDTASSLWTEYAGHPPDEEKSQLQSTLVILLSNFVRHAQSDGHRTRCTQLLQKVQSSSSAAI